MLDEDRIGDLVVQWGQAWEQGQELSIGELCRDNPELKDEVTERVQSVKHMSWLNQFDDDSDDGLLHLPNFKTVANQADETQLPACSLSIEEFATAVVESGLMAADQLQQFRDDHSAEDARSLARQMVEDEKLTRFQASVLLDGSDQPLLLDGYIILDEIGSGGMGAVFKALHQQMDRVVALKILPKEAVDSPDKVKRFQREVKAAAKLEHPHVVTAFDAREDKGFHFLVMSYVKGSDLAETIRKQGPVSTAKAVNYIIQAASGLEHAHNMGIVHRDIKPGNLLLDKKGKVQILDMGLARIENVDGEYDKTVSQELTQAGMVMGTIAYMAPEQALDTSTADAQSDIYSLGCTLYYLLMGKAPYIEGTMMKTIMAHREADIPSLCGERNSVPVELDAIFQKMVAKQPKDRFQDMTEVITALDELEIEDDDETQPLVAMSPAMHETAIFIDTSLNVIEPQPGTESFGPPKRRWPLIAAGVLGAVVLLAGLIIQLSTPAGMVILEVDQPELIGAVVTIDGEKRITIKTGKGQEAINIRPDAKRHELEVTIAGFKTFAKDFTFETGNRQTIRVRSEPLKRLVAKSKSATKGGSVSPKDQSAPALFNAEEAKQHQGTPDVPWQKSHTLMGHTDLVRGVAYSPDGKRVASASYDRTVKVWSTATMQEMLTLNGHTGRVTSVAFSPDGQRIASASDDHTVKVWDIATGHETLTLKGHTDWVRCVSFSPDGLRLASGGFDGTVRVWDEVTGTSTFTLLGHTDRIYSVAFSPDGKRLASASWDNTVRVWGATTGLEVLLLQGHTGSVWGVTFSPDGTQLASGSADKTAKLWDAATGQEILTLNVTRNVVTGVAFSPDGTRLASASDDKMVKIWDVATGQERKTLIGHTSYVQSVAFSPDGTQLVSASADQTVRMWDVTSSN
jgi:WD40 repeat protein/serine/threonine protein kinase